MRTNFDFSPYRRATVGFDRVFDLLEGAGRMDDMDGYPPYDVERQDEDKYCITLALAGFRTADVDIVAQNNLLTITGKKHDGGDERQFLHRGIATRSFERRFQLADFVQVKEASFEEGLLRISLEREVPEAMKPRRISIASAASNDHLVEADASERADQVAA